MDRRRLALHLVGSRGPPLDGTALSLLDDPAAVLLSFVTFYDQRAGGIETSFKGDQQGDAAGEPGSRPHCHSFGSNLGR